MSQRRRTTPRAQGIPHKGSSRTAARDRSFHAASRLTRWVIAGTVGLTALFTAAAAAAFSGHSTTATGPASGQAGGGADRAGTAKVALPPANPGQLSAPPVPPVPASGGGQAVSGGS